MSDDQVFLSREPILDRQGQLAAIAFHLDSDGQDPEVVDNTLYLFTTNFSLGRIKAFVHLPASLLGQVDPPSAENTVVETGPDTTTEQADQLKDLRRRGHQIALDQFDFAAERRPLAGLAQYIKLPLPRLPADRLPGLVGLLREKTQARLIAQDGEGWLPGADLGFDAFQGGSLAPPPRPSNDGLTPSQACVMDVLDKIRRSVDVREIESAFKADAALSFRLLSHINSAGFGLSCEIQSIRHALTILGSQPLYRWVTVLLANATAESSSPALATTAILRGRLTELLGLELLDRNEADNLFIVGIFSVLDRMLGRPMAEILETVHLSDEVSEALLSRSGIYGPFLALTLACEGRDPARVRRLAGELGLDAMRVNQAHFSAMAWAAQMRA